MDAKVDYPAACNFVETLLVDTSIAAEFLKRMVETLAAAGVPVRGCDRTLAFVKAPKLKVALKHDWATEYGDLTLALRVVDGLEQAIAHIHEFGSGHTEAIITEDRTAAEQFLSEVDAAGVFRSEERRVGKECRSRWSPY